MPSPSPAPSAAVSLELSTEAVEVKQEINDMTEGSAQQNGSTAMEVDVLVDSVKMEHEELKLRDPKEECKEVEQEIGLKEEVLEFAAVMESGDVMGEMVVKEEVEKMVTVKGEAEEVTVDIVKEEGKSRESTPVLDYAAQLLKKEVTCAIKSYQKYYLDMDLANKASQPNISNYNRHVLLQKLNSSTEHVDQYFHRIETARTAEQLQVLLTEIQEHNRRARQIADMNRLLRV